MKVLNRQGKIEFVIIATFKRDPMAMSKYKDRWQMDMLKAFKTGGFNFEDTHLIDPESITKLIALACVAFIWVSLVGISRSRITPIKIKKHGCLTNSLFKVGLIFVAHALLNLLSIKDLKS